MTLDGKLLFDYATLLMSPELLNQVENCLVMLPYSSLDSMCDILEQEDASPSGNIEPEALRGAESFVQNIYQLPHLSHQVLEEERMQSDCVCINKEKNVHLCLTGLYIENKYNLPEEIEFSDYMFDIISASIEFDCPIFTDNLMLIDTIKKYKLPVDIITR